MRLKTFRAFSLTEALNAVHDDLGEDAAILHTRTFKRGGLFGLGGREVVEVIASEGQAGTRLPEEAGVASTNSDAPESIAATTPAMPRMTHRARQAYAGMSAEPGTASPPSSPDIDADSGAGSGDSDLESPPSSGSLEVDRERTRKLAQAMAIRLERQRAAREAAGVEGPDDLLDGPPTSIAPAVHEPSEDRGFRSTPPAERFVIGPGGTLIPDRDEDPAVPTTSANPAIVSSDAPRAIEPEPTPPTTMPSSVDSRSGDVDEAIPTAETVAGRAELDAIQMTVRQVLSEGQAAPVAFEGTSDAGSEAVTAVYAALVAQELSRELADRVVTGIESRLDAEALRDAGRVRAAALEELAALIPTEESLEPSRPRDGRPRTLVFVGPTGVGKTTTLAKIAATLVVRDGLSVGLVTADTYRISAVDQLRTYADILDARLEVAADPTAMREAVDRCRDLDVVLVDTPGRSQNDADRLAELGAIVDAARPHETHLVLSGTASERVLLREAEAFGGLGPDRVVLTKLDEAVAFGMLVSVVRRIGRRIGWVTTGQEVPRDIERATGTRLATLVLGGAVDA